MKKQAITLLLILAGFTNTYAQSDPEMVTVEGGTFTMGDTSFEAGKDEQPTHQVTLKTFKIAKTETTVAQWKTFCNATGRAMPQAPEWGWIDSHPIVNINYSDALDYCNWLSEKMDAEYRLPTEAEWEYAARGGKLSKGTNYSGTNFLFNTGWYDSNSNEQTQSVANKIPNELGIYDMSGNAVEWCKDWYGSYSSATQTNPKGATTGTYRVIRGGGLADTDTDCRVATRDFIPPSYSNVDVSFRVVLSQ